MKTRRSLTFDHLVYSASAARAEGNSSRGVFSMFSRNFVRTPNSVSTESGFSFIASPTTAIKVVMPVILPVICPV